MKPKRIISLLVCLLLVLSLSQLSAAASLPDVSGHWAEGKIHQLVELEAITGYPDGTFKPEDTITRAEFSSVMWGALGLDETGGETFTDIEDHWGQGRIEALITEGVIDAEVYNEEYMPDEPITRQEIAMMAIRVLDTNDVEEDIPFEDADQVGAEFYDYVVQAFNNEIITGYPDNTFSPEGTVSRAEAAVMAVRSLRIAGITEEVEIGDMVVHFIDVGQGDCILVETPCETYVLVDAGTRAAGDVVVSYLKDLGVDELKKVVATHEHADHVGGLISVYESPIEVITTYGSSYEHDTQTAEEFRALAKQHSTFKTPSALDALNLGCDHIEATFLHPYARAVGDLHYMNLVLNVEYNDFSVLLTGDAEIETEDSMRGNAPIYTYLPSQVLKVGHHGSRTSTSSDFLDAVNPEAAVIMVGEDNRYGHPHEETLVSLTEAGVEIYRTDEHGNIIVTTDGNTYNFDVAPYRYDPVVDPDPDTEPEPAPERININTASLEELQEIVHIGESRAQEIIEFRPFNSLDELDRISGIGPARLQDIKDEGIAHVE